MNNESQPGLTVDEPQTLEGPAVPSELNPEPAEVPYEDFRHEVNARLAELDAKVNGILAKFS